MAPNLRVYLFSDALPEDLPLFLLLLVLVPPFLLGLLDGLLTEPLLLDLVLFADVIVVVLAAAHAGNAVWNNISHDVKWRHWSRMNRLIVPNRFF